MKLKPLNLQLFAEEASTEETEQQETVELAAGNPEFDAAVSKAVEKALENNNKKWQSKLNEQVATAAEQAKSEAERMAQMNADQKAEYERQQREEDLAKREQAIVARELKAQAVTQLSEVNLPLELVDLINVADSDKAQESFIAVKSAWEKAHGSWESSIEAAVKEKLASSVDNPLGGVTLSGETNPWAKETFNLTAQGILLKENPEKAEILKAQAKQS